MGGKGSVEVEAGDVALSVDPGDLRPMDGVGVVDRGQGGGPTVDLNRRELPVLVQEPLVGETHDVVSDHQASVVDPRREGAVGSIGVVEGGEYVTASVG